MTLFRGKNFSSDKRLEVLLGHSTHPNNRGKASIHLTPCLCQSHWPGQDFTDCRLESPVWDGGVSRKRPRYCVLHPIPHKRGDFKVKRNSTHKSRQYLCPYRTDCPRKLWPTEKIHYVTDDIKSFTGDLPVPSNEFNDAKNFQGGRVFYPFVLVWFVRKVFWQRKIVGR